MNHTFPIAMIPYANMAPFQEMGPPEGCHFVDCVPRDSIQALKDQRVWAAAVPVGGLPLLEGHTHFVGRHGIAVKEKAMSVLFFSNCPFCDFKRPLTVGLTTDSASSVRLLFLLLGYQVGFDAIPHQAHGERKGDGYLVIGDQALQWAQEYERTGVAHGYAHVADLAELWHDRFQLPFVFARWVVHKQAPEPVKTTLQEWLARFSREEPTLIEKAVPKVSGKLALPEAYTARYLRVIRRCLTAEDEAGQLRFEKELEPFGSGPLFEPSQ